MTEEVAKQAKELYEQKAKLSNSLSELVSNDYFGLAYHSGGGMRLYGLSTTNVQFMKEDLVAFVLKRTKEELDKVEQQLKDLNC